MKKSVIIFSQQPADIPLVLSLVRKSVQDSLTIVCVGVQNNYRFFTRVCEKEYKIMYIPRKTLPAPWQLSSFFGAIIFLKYIYKKRFSKICNHDVYFFAKGHDWVSIYLINKLAHSGNNIFFSPSISNTIEVKRYSFRESVLIIAYRWLCSAKVVFANTEMGRLLYWDHPLIKNTNIVTEPVIFEKFRTGIEVGPKTILLLDSNMESVNIIKGYTETMLLFAKQLIGVGYRIHLKAHPRLSYTPGIKEYIESEIPSFIPAEFIDCKNYSYVVGLSSNALSNISLHYSNVVTIIDLFEYIDTNKKNAYKNFLLANPDNQILFISNINELSL